MVDDIIVWALSWWRVLRGMWSRIRWLRNHFIKLLLAVTSGTIAFAFFSIPKGEWKAYLSKPSNYGICFETIAIVTLLYSGVVFSVRQRVKLVLEKLPPLGQGSVKPRTGEEISQFRDQAILYNPTVNVMLDGASNPIHFSKERFEVHPLIREMIPLFIRRMPEAALDTSDDAKVRLFSDLPEDLLRRGGTVHLQATSYFRDRLSNTLANYRVRLEARVLLDLRHEVLDAGGSMISLGESPLSNQLGASTLLLTIDSKIVYLRQGNRVTENKHKLAPAGSGSFDRPRANLRPGCTFQDFAREEARRELCEECGLSVEDIASIQICGFGRYLYRNGKPEVFCIATTRRESVSITVPARELDYQQKRPVFHGFEGEPNAANVSRGLEKLRSRLEGHDPGLVSGPLYWNVLFARDYLDQIDSEAEEALLRPIR